MEGEIYIMKKPDSYIVIKLLILLIVLIGGITLIYNLLTSFKVQSYKENIYSQENAGKFVIIKDTESSLIGNSYYEVLIKDKEGFKIQESYDTEDTKIKDTLNPDEQPYAIIQEQKLGDTTCEKTIKLYVPKNFEIRK